ncbi:hypothetical protein [Hymenobacter sp. UYP22]|uniref:hypothetical protein n=1 Tax=Hymenobacter sp. UYP22 TaxID=3156348 RepID=UPI003396AD6D
MHHNATLSLLLGLTLAFTAGCSKDDQELPAPTPEAVPEPSITYSRAIVYQDNGQRRDTTFQAAQLVASATQSTHSLSVGVAPATTAEGIRFTLDRTKLPATFSGTYTLQTLRDRTLDAETRFYYDLPERLGGGTVIYPSGMQHVTGNFVISGYDAKRQLLSGTYTTTLTGANDPTVAYSTFPKRKCDITVSGTFANIPVRAGQ